jgi:hypothetical protein
MQEQVRFELPRKRIDAASESHLDSPTSDKKRGPETDAIKQLTVKQSKYVF